MSSKSDPRKIKRLPLVVISISAFFVVMACAYNGYKIGGLTGAAIGIFFGLAISGC